jgi:hypothetical protein
MRFIVTIPRIDQYFVVDSPNIHDRIDAIMSLGATVWTVEEWGEPLGEVKENGVTVFRVEGK